MFFGSGAAAAAAKAFKELACLGWARAREALNLGWNYRRPGDVSPGGWMQPDTSESTALAGGSPAFWVFGVNSPGWLARTFRCAAITSVFRHSRSCQLSACLGFWQQGPQFQCFWKVQHAAAATACATCACRVALAVAREARLLVLVFGHPFSYRGQFAYVQLVVLCIFSFAPLCRLGSKTESASLCAPCGVRGALLWCAARAAGLGDRLWANRCLPAGARCF